MGLVNSLEYDPSVVNKRKKKRKSKEGVFLSELGKTFKSYGAFWHKISDSPVSMLRGARFEKSKPFDAISVYKGIAIAIEAKWIEDYKAFGFHSLRESQKEGLASWRDSGGRSFVFLNIRRTADKENDIQRQNRLMIFDYNDLERIDRNLRKRELLELSYIEGRRASYNLDLFFEVLTGERA